MINFKNINFPGRWSLPDIDSTSAEKLMQLYKPVIIDNLDVIVSKVLDFFPENKRHFTSLFYIDDNKNKILSIPELADALGRYDLLEHVYGIGFYIVHQDSPLTIHKDNGDIIYSLNIPLSGCANTFVNFYSASTGPEEKTTLAGNKYFAFAEQNCTLIDRLEMTTPHIINVKVPHAVENHNSAPRITMLIRLNSSVGELF